MEMELCVRRGNMLPCKILECYMHLSSEQLKILFSDILKISWDCFLKSEIKCNILFKRDIKHFSSYILPKMVLLKEGKYWALA